MASNEAPASDEIEVASPADSSALAASAHDAPSGADDSPPSAYAWALWHGWRGTPELVAHAARAGLRGIRDVVGGSPVCSIDVRVPLNDPVSDDMRYDTERFSSPDAFKDVTTDALRRFESIHVSVVGEDVEASIEFARHRRKETPRPWLRGVLLEVRSEREDLHDKIGQIASVIFTAVDRGRNSRHRKPERSGASSATSPDELAREQERQRRRQLLVTGASVPLFVAVYTAVFWSTGGFDEGWYLPVGSITGGALLGLVPQLVAVWLFPSVEVADVTRSGRVVHVLRLILFPAIGATAAVIGLIIRT